MKKRLLFFLFLVSILFVDAAAQQLKATSFSVSMDITASRFEVKDANGVPCAVVKVHLPMRDADFDREWVIGEPTYDHGIYTLYMPQGARKLIIKYDEFERFEVAFRKVNPDLHTLQSRITYDLVIELSESYRLARQARDAQSQVQGQPAANAATSSSANASSTVTVPQPLPKLSALYGNLGFIAASPMGIELGVGGYFSGINAELDLMLPLGASEELVWNHAENTSHYCTYKPALGFAARLGYGIRIGEKFHITPQLGLRHLSVSETNDTDSSVKHADGAYCSSLLLAARLQYMFSKHIGVSLSPEYDLALIKSDGFKTLSEPSTDIKKWNNGVGVKLALEFEF